MSILERFLNPRRAERDDREQRAEVERRREVTGDPPSRCKACGYEGEDPYCPRCLADTMRKVPRPRAT
jgi:predicted Zn-ribbon and HTH transcriptional regulator